MTDKLRELLEDVQTVYEGKGMIVHPNSFDKLRMEVIKLDNVNRLQNEQIDKLTKELDEYKSIDKRLICNHKYFTSDIKNNNLAVVCHSILDCDKCGRWEEE